METLNWFDNRKFTARLRRLCKEKDGVACTIRLGPKWADKFNPGDFVKISISNDPNQPKIIGQAKIVAIEKIFLKDLVERGMILERNIGATKFNDVCKTLRRVYGKEKVNQLFVISIICLDFKK